MTADEIRRHNQQTIVAALKSAGVIGLALVANGYNDEGSIHRMGLVTAEGISPGEESYEWNSTTRRNVVVPAQGIHALKVDVIQSGDESYAIAFPPSGDGMPVLGTQSMSLTEAATELAGFLFDRDEDGYGTGEERVEDTFVIRLNTSWDELACSRTSSSADTLAEAAEIITGARSHEFSRSYVYGRMRW